MWKIKTWMTKTHQDRLLRWKAHGRSGGLVSTRSCDSGNVCSMLFRGWISVNNILPLVSDCSQWLDTSSRRYSLVTKRRYSPVFILTSADRTVLLSSCTMRVARAKGQRPQGRLSLITKTRSPSAISHDSWHHFGLTVQEGKNSWSQLSQKWLPITWVCFQHFLLHIYDICHS